MAISGTVLVIKTSHDAPTKYGSYWMDSVIQKARSLGYSVFVVSDQEDVRQLVEKALQSHDPLLVIGAGHGEADRFSGWLNQIIFQAGDNEGDLSNRIVYLLACVCGKELGPSIVRKGGVAFLGFSDYFLWAVQGSQNPVGDPIAKPFMDVNSTIAFGLLEGKPVGDIFKEAIALSDRLIDEWSRKTDPNAPLVVQFLLHDRDILVALGEKGAAVEA